MTLRQKIGTWILGGPTTEDKLIEEIGMQRIYAREQLSKERESAKVAESEGREASRRLMEGTLDVMRELVASVNTQQQTLSNYLALFTSSSKPELRSMDDAALYELEAAQQHGKRRTQAVSVASDPFGWMADRPDLFDPQSPEVLHEIKQSIGAL